MDGTGCELKLIFFHTQCFHLGTTEIMIPYRKKSSSSPSVSRVLIVALVVLACVGLFFCWLLIPLDSNSGPSTNSLLYSTNSEPLSVSLRTLAKASLPEINYHRNEDGSDSSKDTVVIPDEENSPDWSQEFWTPIDLDPDGDPMVVLCKLNFKKYSESPHLTPMFKDLVGISRCVGGNRRRERLSKLKQELIDEQHRIVPPSGFVFHESRVGSTLVANLLASNEYNLVFSESAPAANALLHCQSCTHQKKVDVFRDIVTLMGRSPFHKRLFFKFQSITSTKMAIALEAFPDVPWTFVYRNPVQTMMSHLDPDKRSYAAPCLRSKGSRPDEVMQVLRKVQSNSNEAWCAAHLNMLCNFALQSYHKFNATSDHRLRALLIDYDSLPGIVPRAVLPLFGITPSSKWLAHMSAESKPYSKSRAGNVKMSTIVGGASQFSGDSADKEQRATEEIKEFAEKILAESFVELQQHTREALQEIRAEIVAESDKEVIDVENFSAMKEMPEKSVAIRRSSRRVSVSESSSSEVEKQEVSGSDEIKHSEVLKEEEFVSFKPFANHHSSKPFEQVDCPMHPTEDYPKAYQMLKILSNWNADVTDIPDFHYDSLCHFDYTNETQRQQALNYRAQEKPFVAYNIPEVDDVVRRWNDVDYLSKMLGSKTYRTEASKDNHFMYWSGGRNFRGSNWTPPTSVINTRFEDWITMAVRGQNETLEERKHLYFRVSSDSGNHWLFNELPFFQPKKNFFIVQPREQRGIHCRFGMRSVIAEAHFDGSRNAVVMLGGMRRWILTHPDQCKHMHMLQRPHPSARHSEVDWSKPDVQKFPNFEKVHGNEVILRPGDYLFVPTYWIHYIVSLNVNFQCNTRSGVFHGYDKDIQECGF